MTQQPTFNLLDEPWILARTLSGDATEISLTEVLLHSHQIKSIAGEIPTQDAAIVRLLLAVLLGATRDSLPRSEDQDEEPRSEDQDEDLWSEWHSRGHLPEQLVGDYLESHRDRFFLFHPSAPFMQVADLDTPKGKRSGLTKMIAEVPDGYKQFTTRAGAGVASLDFAEAARWLVHTQQFDPAGIKTGAVGDPRVKRGKGYPLGYPAWAGNIGVVIAEGRSLFETLLYNLPLRQAHKNDLPVWERPPQTSAPNREDKPSGPADLFTWQSRRMRLFTVGDRVCDVLVCNGDRLAPQNLHPFEPMCAWRYSKDRSKRSSAVPMPVTHSSKKIIWQGLASLIAPADGNDPLERAVTFVPWLARLIEDGVLDGNAPIVTRVIGFEYGNQNSVINALVSDALPAAVIALVNERLRTAAIDAAKHAADGTRALADLSGNLARAVGGDPEAPRNSAFEQGYAVLDMPYRGWLSTLNDPGSAEVALGRWDRMAYRLLDELGADMIRMAGPAALIGRELNDTAKAPTKYMDAAQAQIIFRSALSRTFKSPVHSDESDNGYDRH